jgi:peptidoglycan hydrolase CwlO-like protein
MQIIKRITLFTSMLCLSASVVTFAEANTEGLQQDLAKKAEEKQAVNLEMQNIQQEIDSLNAYITNNNEEMTKTIKRIEEINQLIEKKKEDIVILEDKILARKEVMKKRVVALQTDSNVNFVIDVLIDAKSLGELLDRANAVTTILNADKNIYGALEDDLNQIEKDKAEIDRQQQNLAEEQKVLAKQQEELDQNLQKRQASLSEAQAKYSQINQEMAQAQEQIIAAQEQIRREQEAAKLRTVTATTTNEATPVNGVELYVSATAYSPEDSGALTYLGYNIKANPNMKLIAVDPTVIPLGKKVWVEGYGEAIAGDTGSAIKGHKIDVLVPNRATAISWGRKTVKIVILN